jgi:hypothetical protein
MTLPIRRVVLYKHGVGYFEREGTVTGAAALTLTFQQREVSDVLKSLTVLDTSGGHISSVSYDSTKPVEQLLAEVALNIPDRESVVGLLPQIKGARVALHSGVADPVTGSLLGVDTTERQTGDGVVKIVLVSVLTDSGSVRSFDLHNLASLQILDDALRRDLEFYLRTRLSATKKDARTFTFFAQGEGERTIRLSYTLEAPVWKATYRILLGQDGEPSLIQGWAVVDNMQDEDWEEVQLSLISGLPVSFVHDLYTPRYIRRPEVKVKDTTGVLPPEVEEAMLMQANSALAMRATPLTALGEVMGARAEPQSLVAHKDLERSYGGGMAVHRPSSTPTQVREQVLGDLLEYRIELPVTIRRNQSALVPIVLRPFEGSPVLLYNKANRPNNPMNAVLFKNSTGLTLEGGPVMVLQEGSYVGEAMLDTLKPDEERLVPYAVELGVSVLDNLDSSKDEVYRVTVQGGFLTAHHLYVQQTTYTFKNKSDRKHVVYLEHPRSGDAWQLIDTPAPLEVTQNYWRFRFELPGRGQTAFVVKQRQTQGLRYQLNDTGEGSFEFWLEQKYLDDKIKSVLRQAQAQRLEQVRLAEHTQQLEKERADIFAAQQRIRENLQSLGDRSTEKELRERFVKTLNNQEDRLEEIAREIKEQEVARHECWEKIQALVAQLEYDAPVPKP